MVLIWWVARPFAHVAEPVANPQRDEDYSYFHMLCPSVSDTTIFGISCNRQLPSEQLKRRSKVVTRSTVQKAIVVLASQPVFGPIRDKLGVITRAFFAQKDFEETEILVEFFSSLESGLHGSGMSAEALDDHALYMGALQDDAFSLADSTKRHFNPRTDPQVSLQNSNAPQTSFAAKEGHVLWFKRRATLHLPVLPRFSNTSPSKQPPRLRFSSPRDSVSISREAHRTKDIGQAIASQISRAALAHLWRRLLLSAISTAPTNRPIARSRFLPRRDD
jgi:hypothetical protein